MSNFTISTAIAYVNDKPHIGHAMDFLYADIIARYHRQKGDTVVYSLGVDEHGQKIAEKAAAANQTPQQYIEPIVDSWKEFVSKLGVKNDVFVRTTDASHERGAQAVWNALEQYIYKASYKGWYCVGCEEFKTDTYVKETNGVCPDHNRQYDEIEEENYFFKLSAFNEQLIKLIESDQLKIIPESRKNETLNVLKDGLKDFSISRSTSKLTWGIPVPGDSTQVMYVWFEALMNYATMLGYPDSENFKNFWPTNVNVIGKDILRFHAVVWPAMLLGLGLKLPETVYAHGHVSSGGKKMSKTLGNVIDPVQVIDEYGLDPFRYYFARHISSHDDGDFSWEKYTDVYNAELANELGNAVSRVAGMVKRYQDGIIGDIPEADHDSSRYYEFLDEFRFDKALEAVWEQVRGLNQYVEEEKPWEIAKENDPEHLQEVLASAGADLLEIAELLTPFMPDTAAKIESVFKEGIIRELDGPLFPRVETAS